MLERVRLPTRINQVWTESGMDSIDACFDINVFMNYPYDISYCYNSRGFRDDEWPEDLNSAVWCFGDSFTVGLGVPVDHTWPRVLETAIGRRCINVSMDGASNNWIARTVNTVLTDTRADVAVIQWSFIERREGPQPQGFDNKSWYVMYQSIRDPSWPDCNNINDFPRLPVNIQQEILNVFLPQHPLVTDEQLRSGCIACTEQEDIRNTLECIHSVEATARTQGTRLIHSFIPMFMIDPLLSEFFAELDRNNYTHIGATTQLDLARDGYHYDIKTAQEIVKRMVKIIVNK